MDGEPLFRFENWRSVEHDNLFFSVSNTLIPRDGTTSVIYVDDAAISAVPVTPDGKFEER
jgi:hypothetical protein